MGALNLAGPTCGATSLPNAVTRLPYIGAMTIETPNTLGARAESAVASALVRAGHDVFIPAFCAHSRVDLIYLDPAGTTKRVQCKNARVLKGGIGFRTASNTGNITRPYHGEIDEFGAFSVETGLVYLVPIEVVGDTFCCLRTTPTRNGQLTGIRWADDYVLGEP